MAQIFEPSQPQSLPQWRTSSRKATTFNLIIGNQIFKHLDLWPMGMGWNIVIHATTEAKDTSTSFWTQSAAAYFLCWETRIPFARTLVQQCQLIRAFFWRMLFTAPFCSACWPCLLSSVKSPGAKEQSLYEIRETSQWCWPSQHGSHQCWLLFCWISELQAQWETLVQKVGGRWWRKTPSVNL